MFSVLGLAFNWLRTSGRTNQTGRTKVTNHKFFSLKNAKQPYAHTPFEAKSLKYN